MQYVPVRANRLEMNAGFSVAVGDQSAQLFEMNGDLAIAIRLVGDAMSPVPLIKIFLLLHGNA